MVINKELLIITLRNKKSSREQFRYAAQQLSHLLAQEAVDIALASSTTTNSRLTNEVVLIPILRSGISMLPIFLHYFPDAAIGMVGLKRDETTAQASLYYAHLPPLNNNQQIIILDPMIATGGTALATLNLLKEKGIKQEQIIFASIICAPEGINAITAAFAAIKIIKIIQDECLDEQKYIVPGLGDFGDRFFGTE